MDKTEINLNILNQISNENLEIIRQDAEKRFDNIDKANDTLISKCNALFQVVLALLISLIAYLANKFIGNSLLDNFIIQISLLILSFSFVTLIMTYKVLFPEAYRMKGAKPSFHIQEDIECEDKKKQTQIILKNSIETLEGSIMHNLSLHKKQASNYKAACQIFMLGIGATILYTIIYSFI
ncbi:hypothetical protein [Flavobacterium phycosphaerae]|uniref:hypothetical protein n=1 Tax=Flavobacterium phycosphaerae TaxID=2697515 RepID=UPI00138A19D1|nr:hypothetical protein [Flavobacterium phycosphaerae]